MSAPNSGTLVTACHSCLHAKPPILIDEIRARRVAQGYERYDMFGFKQPPPPPPVRVQIVSEDALLLTFFAAGVLLIISLAPLSEPGKISARRVYSLSAALLAASTLALTAFEPNISAIDSFYLACMTFTTIGYGDVEYPASPAGRVLVSLLALGGIAFFAVTLEMVHSMRRRTDGAALGSLFGVPSHSDLLAGGMLAVNFALGAGLCSFLTDDHEMPKGVLDSLYWCVITSTSVGFGDFHPTTALGKVCVCAYAFCTMQATANAMDVAKEKLIQLCTTPSAPTKRD